MFFLSVAGSGWVRPTVSGHGGTARSVQNGSSVAAFVPGTGWPDSDWRLPTDRAGVIDAVTVAAGKLLEARRTGPGRFLAQMA
jgi:hypothetical protein